ncbi:TniQ family protein [Pseudofrankia sp. BMG5.37]|uniref:TniQ family protein n=1 Tax=Pseudofrankia sp. BMG5.37 TaxID=3050035 RepID=UPI0028961179|nr:TniQ family protein [Pseudofrankia sp. BMG5.37]MDT3444499.1 TniQ family protein [Pseudofrankia sp. BMG5.37]
MTSRLPFILTPLPGESFASWFHAYARRLGVSVPDLAVATGMPPTPLPTGPGRWTDRLDQLAVATALPLTTLRGLFHPAYAAALPAHTPAAFMSACTPGNTTRFCPTCLADHPGRFQLAWQLRWTVFCQEHNQPLAETCPRCATPPTYRAPRSGLPPGACPSPRPDGIVRTRRGHAWCGADLASAAHPACPDPSASHRAQDTIDLALAQLTAPQTGQHARDTLTDLLVIAHHEARRHAPRAPQQRPRVEDLRVDTLTVAVTLLTDHRAYHGDDPLTALATAAGTGPRPRAVAPTWKTGSSQLSLRVARLRDSALRPLERLRHLTTLPVARPVTTGLVDPAVRRAARIPDQLWPSWTVRLIDDDAFEPYSFRAAAAVALLLPGSTLELRAIAPLINDAITPQPVAFQMGKLSRATRGGTQPLRILTELALAIDTHPIPIDYARRRRLLTTTDVLDPETWKALVAGQPLHNTRRRLGFARHYLYELLTGGNLAIAPQPYRLPEGERRFAYLKFVLGMPAPLSDALADHATTLLHNAGITNEPLHWEPPTSWINTQDWPGADPTHTDPAPIHAQLTARAPIGLVAATHNISIEHLRQLMRLHPLPAGQPLPPRTGAILPLQTPHPGPHYHHAGVHYIDLGWLHTQYVTSRRTFRDIAKEIGCSKGNLLRFAEAQKLPIRDRGGNKYLDYSGDPATLPEPLRSALIGQKSQARLRRFPVIARNRTLAEAAMELGVTASTLSTQLTSLEHACGGALMHRAHPRRLTGPTALGRALHQQILDHLETQP